MSERGNERERIASLRNPWFTASVGITAAIAIVGAIVGFAWLPLQQQASGSAGSGTRSAVPPASFGTHLPAGRSSAPIIRRRASKSSRRCCSGASAESIGRGATLGAALHDVPRRPRPEPGQHAQSRRAIPGRDLQAARRFQNRRAHQRGHGPARGRSQRRGHARPRRLLRLSAARLRSIRAAVERAAPHRRERRADARASRPAAPVTATSTARPARRGSRDSPRSICAPSSRLSPPAPGATTSASRCATSRARMTPEEIDAASRYYADRP